MDLPIGSIETGKRVIYPITNFPDGTQRVNGFAEIYRAGELMNDWNRCRQAGMLADLDKDWTGDWLDLPALIKGAESSLQVPMADKHPIAQWTLGRVTLLGEAAQPMHPRGSNGSAPASIDGHVLAAQFAAASGDLAGAVQAQVALGRPVTSTIVLTNRASPPDVIVMKAGDLSGSQPFRPVDDLISQDARRKISENYAAGCRVAGLSREALKASGGPLNTIRPGLICRKVPVMDWLENRARSPNWVASWQTRRQFSCDKTNSPRSSRKP